MKMYDMKAPGKEGIAEPTTTKSAYPDYPYGLSLTLSNDQLKKLGISDIPKIGAVMHIEAKAVVTSASQSDNRGGGVERRMELQLQKIGLKEGHASAEEAMGEAIEKAKV